MGVTDQISLRNPEAVISVRRMLMQVHLWTGLILFAPLVLIGLTGSVLVFRQELAAVLAPDIHASAGGAMRSVGEIVDAARTRAPEGGRPTMVFMPELPGEPAAVRFTRQAVPAISGAAPPTASTMHVFVDPVSLAVLGAQDGFLMAEPLLTIHRLHANLLIDGRDGRAIVGWFGIAMLVLGVTGLMIWWPKPGKWRRALSVKRGARGVRLHRDLHGATGIWCFLVFIVVSFSGVYLAFPKTTGAAISAVLPARDLRSMAAAYKAVPIDGRRPIDTNQAVDLALAAAPGTRLQSVALAQRPDQPVRVILARPEFERGQPPITVFVDPWAPRIIEVRDPQNYTAGETVIAWQRPLHTGEGLSWVYKVAVCVAGFLPLLFAITGLSMWILKRRARRSAAHESALVRPQDTGRI